MAMLKAESEKPYQHIILRSEYIIYQNFTRLLT